MILYSYDTAGLLMGAPGPERVEGSMGCTDVPPPELDPGQVPRWNGSEWEATAFATGLTFYHFDSYGWFTVKSSEFIQNSTILTPPKEVSGQRARFVNGSWMLETPTPETLGQSLSLVLTSAEVDAAHVGHPDVELGLEDGEISAPAGTTLTIRFEVRLGDSIYPATKTWKLPLQAVDAFGRPAGPSKFAFARLVQGEGCATFSSKTGESMKFIIDYAVVNAGFTAQEPRLSFDKKLNIVFVE